MNNRLKTLKRYYKKHPEEETLYDAHRIAVIEDKENTQRMCIWGLKIFQKTKKRYIEYDDEELEVKIYFSEI